MTGESLSPETIEAQNNLITFINAFTELDVSDASAFEFCGILEADDGAGFNAIAKLVEVYGVASGSATEDLVFRTNVRGYEFEAGVKYYKTEDDAQPKKVSNVSLLANKPETKFLWRRTPGQVFRIDLGNPDKGFGNMGYVKIGDKVKHFSLTFAFDEEDMYRSYSDDSNIGHIPVVAQRIDMETFRNNLVDLSICLLIATGSKIAIKFIQSNDRLEQEAVAVEGLRLLPAIEAEVNEQVELDSSGEPAKPSDSRHLRQIPKDDD